ncbi:hypothetical protein K7957_18685 [Sphingomonas yunnanensis]|uniref:pYEATS domain-containing protein n=1 Tax=Sphingomonas yunnanensis TaxID=310400 RepID=UPI001CA63707|nr:pYEATS domain-containing protein [Sphingomonas yunnanensis]MBY9064966.1 hypothetical protein [Sphingomonas yunnanensis]
MEDAGKLLEGIASLGWIGLIAVIVYVWRSELRTVLAAAADRARAGTGFELGPFKFASLDVVGFVGQPVEERQAGKTTITSDPERQKEILQQQKDCHFAFLTHYVYPRRSALDSYGVALYLTGHFNALEHVDRVEHFLGVGWDDAVFESTDRSKQFAVKVGAVGSFLAMARIHFYDGRQTTLSRFIELKPLQ